MKFQHTHLHTTYLFSAAECRTFLLYYVPAVLHGILPDKYLVYVLLLSKSIRILLGNYIAVDDVEVAHTLLSVFWRLTEEYYG